MNLMNAAVTMQNAVWLDICQSNFSAYMKFPALLAVWKTEGKGLEGPNTCIWNKPLQNSCDCRKGSPRPKNH